MIFELNVVNAQVHIYTNLGCPLRSTEPTVCETVDPSFAGQCDHTLSVTFLL